MKRAVKYISDLVLVNGTVFTGNPTQKRAQAVAIKGNRIIAVGSDAGILALAGKSTRKLDLGGRFVCAGFNDAHLHLLGGGLALSRVDLRGAASFEDLRARIQEAAARLPEGAWIQGRGWDQSQLPGGTWPSKELLDEAAGGRPALLYRVDGHTAWANSAALEAAGIGSGTENPSGGEILRDPSGAPTGVLLETASALVESAVPQTGGAERRAAVLAALAEFRRLGITSVSDFSPPEAARHYLELHQEGRLTVRISVWGALSDDVGAAEGFREQFLPENPFLRCTTLKAYLDGTLGARTAALLAPYEDAPGERGLVRMEGDQLHRLLSQAQRSGFQVALHSIGDAATRTALAAIEGLGEEGHSRRHRIEHAEVVDPADIPRFVAAGAVASMQPAQLISDLRWLVPRIGSQRVNTAFPWRRLADSGARVIFGSDWPIEPLNPMLGLFASVATLRAEGLPALGLRAEAQFSAEEALAAFTTGPAWATFESRIKGAIVAGHLADLVVLSDDPTLIEPERIPALEVDYTVFDGKVVHARESASQQE